MGKSHLLPPALSVSLHGDSFSSAPSVSRLLVGCKKPSNGATPAIRPDAALCNKYRLAQLLVPRTERQARALETVQHQIRAAQCAPMLAGSGYLMATSMIALVAIHAAQLARPSVGPPLF